MRKHTESKVAKCAHYIDLGLQILIFIMQRDITLIYGATNQNGRDV